MSKAWVTKVSRLDKDEKYTCKELNNFQLVFISKYISKVSIFPFLQVPHPTSECNMSWIIFELHNFVLWEFLHIRLYHKKGKTVYLTKYLIWSYTSLAYALFGYQSHNVILFLGLSNLIMHKRSNFSLFRSRLTYTLISCVKMQTLIF